MTTLKFLDYDVLEENFIGNDVSVNNEFIILGYDEPYLTEHNLTIHAFEEKIIRNKEVIIRIVPEQTIVIPNYRNRMHSNLELTYFQNMKNNCFTVRLLDNNDMHEIVEKTEYILINASSIIKENVLYKVTIRVVDDIITFELLDEKGFLFSEIADIEIIKESGIRIIVEYEPDSIIIINNFQTEILEQTSFHFFNDYRSSFQVTDDQNKETEVTDDQNKETEVTEMSELSKANFGETQHQKPKSTCQGLNIFFWSALIVMTSLTLTVLMKRNINYNNEELVA